LITNGVETVFYDIFQTGIDNYDFAFYSAYKSDTSKLFNYKVNDAVYTSLKLERRIENDTLFIETNMPTDEQNGLTIAGTKYCLKRKKTTHSSFKN